MTALRPADTYEAAQGFEFCRHDGVPALALAESHGLRIADLSPACYQKLMEASKGVVLDGDKTPKELVTARSYFSLSRNGKVNAQTLGAALAYCVATHKSSLHHQQVASWVIYNEDIDGRRLLEGRMADVLKIITCLYGSKRSAPAQQWRNRGRFIKLALGEYLNLSAAILSDLSVPTKARRCPNVARQKPPGTHNVSTNLTLITALISANSPPTNPSPNSILRSISNW